MAITDRRAELLLLAVAVIAATGWIMSKTAMLEFQPYTFMALRFVLAAAVLAVFCVGDLRRLSTAQLFRSLATGVALGCALLSWSVGLHMTDNVGEGAFIVSLTVVVVPLIGRVFFGYRLTLLLIISLIPAICGLYFLARDNINSEVGFSLEPAQLLFLLSTLAFATHLNLSSYFVKGISPLALSSLQLGMVGLMAALGAWWFDPPLASQSFLGATISTQAWLLLLASALFATSLRFSLQTRALQQLPPSHSGMILLAEPVCTAVMSAWWLGERMSANQISGCLLIFSGVIVYRSVPLMRRVRSW